MYVYIYIYIYIYICRGEIRISLIRVTIPSPFWINYLTLEITRTYRVLLWPPRGGEILYLYFYLLYIYCNILVRHANWLWNEKLSLKQTVSFQRTLGIINTVLTLVCIFSISQFALEIFSLNWYANGNLHTLIVNNIAVLLSILFNDNNLRYIVISSTLVTRSYQCTDYNVTPDI